MTGETADLTVKVDYDDREAQEGMKETEAMIKRLGKEGAAATKVFNDRVKNLQASLLGLGLSALFIGIQVQRAFEDIARTSTNTFLKITASAGPAFSAVQAMGAAMEFLQFAVGAAINTALEPFLPMILDIIDAIANWVDENPELAGGLIIAGIALGAMLVIGGQFSLLLSSMVPAVKLLASFMGIDLVTGAKAAGVATQAFSFGGLASLATKLGVAAAAAYGLYVMFGYIGTAAKNQKVNVGGFGDILSVIAKVILSVIDGFFIGVVLLVTGVTLIAMKIIQAFVVVAEGIRLVLIQAINFIAGAFDGLVKSVAIGVNFLIAALNKLLEIYNRVFQANEKLLQPIDASGFSVGHIDESGTSAKLNQAAKDFSDFSVILANMDALLKPALNHLNETWTPAAQNVADATTAAGGPMSAQQYGAGQQWSQGPTSVQTIQIDKLEMYVPDLKGTDDINAIYAKLGLSTGMALKKYGVGGG